MKYLLCIGIFVPMLVWSQEAYKGIQFEKNLSWEGVKAKSKAENKYIFLDAYTTWCVPCKQMEKNIYPNDTIGKLMNDRFISVMVQMDSTGRDNERVRSWYRDAKEIAKKYPIPGYPSFLFFNPEGTLIYKGLGYKDVVEFSNLVSDALDPKNMVLYSRLEAYQKGEKNYDELQELALFVKNTLGNDSLARIIGSDYIKSLNQKQRLDKDKILFIRDVAGNRALANTLAKEYKTAYLDRLSEEELLNKENLRFIDQFNDLITSSDNIFKLSYSNPGKVDSATNFNGAAEHYVHSTINREELRPKLFKDDKPVFKKPEWSELSKLIKNKYPGVNVNDLILNYQIAYYNKLKDWPKWAKYQNQFIIESANKSPLTETDAFWKLNLPAWNIFLVSNDRKVLNTALKWSDLSIKLGEKNPNVQCLDTRANLLYKLGRVKEAIRQQEETVRIIKSRLGVEGYDIQQLTQSAKKYQAIADKMKRGEPTYLDAGAVWSPESLKGIRKKQIK